MVKWVARLAFLAALLGFVGTIVIIFYLEGQPTKEKLSGGPMKESPTNTLIDSAVLQPAPATVETLPLPKPEVILKKEDTVKIELPLKPTTEKKPATEEVRKTGPKRSDKKVEEKPKIVKKEKVKKEQEEKLLNAVELQQIVRRINRAKQGKNGYSNCVQLFSTPETSNTRTMSQIETYLKSNHFSIAGRETISKKVRGIQITPAGGCLRVTVGSF